jgi:hypothetical protein
MNQISNAQDIEIYAENLPVTVASKWISSVLGDLTASKKKKGMPKRAHPFSATWNDQTFMVVVFVDVVPGYTSIWFDNPTLPWENDEQCAIDAAKALQLKTRVTAGGWDQEADPDAWIEIDAQGNKTPLIWKT